MPSYGLYQPFIEDRNVRRLYRLKVRFKNKLHKRMPMTVLINRILDDFFDAQGEGDSESDALNAASPEFLLATPSLSEAQP
ncbi:MAG: hypothetical protein ABIT01_20365 [Thermoanaerobaculia bacterium]